MKCDRKIRKRKRLQKKRGSAGDGGGGVAGLQEEKQRLQTSGGPAALEVLTLHAVGSFLPKTLLKGYSVQNSDI